MSINPTKLSSLSSHVAHAARYINILLKNSLIYQRLICKKKNAKSIVQSPSLLPFGLNMQMKRFNPVNSHRKECEKIGALCH
jgi:hypothetical protein